MLAYFLVCCEFHYGIAFLALISTSVGSKLVVVSWSWVTVMASWGCTTAISWSPSWERWGSWQRLVSLCRRRSSTLPLLLTSFTGMESSWSRYTNYLYTKYITCWVYVHVMYINLCKLHFDISPASTCVCTCITSSWWFSDTLLLELFLYYTCT